MIIGIDASNIKNGGGLTHLVELIKNTRSDSNYFSKIIIYAPVETLKKIPDKEWLEKCTHSYLNSIVLYMLLWQKYYSGKEFRSKNTDVLFVPGGSYTGNFKPFVTMSRNMLPIELHEAFRYKSFIKRFRFIFLRYSQIKTFRKAQGLIFLTEYAKEKTMAILNKKTINVNMIPHGINNVFICPPREQKDISEYNEKKPYRLLYVSPITVYKHQWCLVEAVHRLREMKIPVELDLIGTYYKPAFQKYQKAILIFDPKESFIHYHGPIYHPELAGYYKNADAFVYASSCENMPNIVLEAMAAGLPIASSDRGPMPEILKDSGYYFNPENIDSIVNALHAMISNKDKRTENSNGTFKLVKNYSWKKTSDRTFKYLYDINQKAKNI